MYQGFAPDIAAGRPATGMVPVFERGANSGSDRWVPTALALGVIAALPNVFFVAPTNPSSNPSNGSIVAPFTTITDAVAAIAAEGSGTIVLAPGDYTAEVLVTVNDKNVTIFGWAGEGTLPELPSFVFSSTGADFDATFQNCIIDAGEGTTVDASLGYEVAFFQCEDISISGNPDFIDINGGNVSSVETIDGQVRYRDCEFDPGVNLSAVFHDFDNETLVLAVQAVGTITGEVGPTLGQSITWGSQATAVNSFLILGTRTNATAAAIEANAAFQVSRPGVLRKLVGFSPAAQTYTLRINGVDTPLTVSVNNTIVQDLINLVSVSELDDITILATGGGASLVSVEFV